MWTSVFLQFLVLLTANNGLLWWHSKHTWSSETASDHRSSLEYIDIKCPAKSTRLPVLLIANNIGNWRQLCKNEPNIYLAPSLPSGHFGHLGHSIGQPYCSRPGALLGALWWWFSRWPVLPTPPTAFLHVCWWRCPPSHGPSVPDICPANVSSLSATSLLSPPTSNRAVEFLPWDNSQPARWLPFSDCSNGSCWWATTNKSRD